MLRRFEQRLQDSHPAIALPYWNTSVDRSTTAPLWSNNFLGQYNSAERVIHNPPHNWVGGETSDVDSPHDPAFYLHHCWIDKLWARWQLEHPGAPFAPSGAGFGLNDPPMQWPDCTLAAVIDHHALGYSYDFEETERISPREPRMAPQRPSVAAARVRPTPWASLPATRGMPTAPNTASIGTPTGTSINDGSRGNIVDSPVRACYRGHLPRPESSQRSLSSD